MANIHTLDEIRIEVQQPQTTPFPALPRTQQSNSARMRTLNIGNNTRIIFERPPIKDIFAPKFSTKTFIFYISVIQTTIFIAELVLSIFFVSNPNHSYPSSHVSRLMGAKYLPSIQNGQIYRFFAPALLHSGFFHFFSNMLSQTMIGYDAESKWGTKTMIFVYICSAMGGTFLSCIGQPNAISVGASGALLGVIGFYVSWMMMNWNDIRASQQMCNLVVWILIIFLIGSTSDNIDNYAHFGGLLTGFLMGFAMAKSSKPVKFIANNLKIFKVTSILVLVVLFALCIFMIFVVIKPSV